MPLCLCVWGGSASGLAPPPTAQHGFSGVAKTAYNLHKGKECRKSNTHSKATTAIKFSNSLNFYFSPHKQYV
jgi:hypothetical protein